MREISPSGVIRPRALWYACNNGALRAIIRNTHGKSQRLRSKLATMRALPNSPQMLLCGRHDRAAALFLGVGGAHHPSAES